MGGGEMITEALRPLVGSNGWDFCITWKLSPDQRYLVWMSCCCSGVVTQSSSAAEIFPLLSTQKFSCRDNVYQHARTGACDTLEELPLSIPLDSSLGNFYVKTLKMGEDQQAVEFVMSQCTMDIGGADDGVQSWTEPPEPMAADGSTAFPWDMPHPVDQARLFGPSLGLFSGPMVDHLGAEAIFNGPANNNGGDSGGGGGAMTAIAGLNFNGPVPGSVDEPAKSEGAAAQRAESGSEGSDHGEIDDDENRTKSGGKRHHSKNLVAERRRRKKLNDRLYSLRSLVPKITKMDRASILGDAIEYIMELQKQVKELQDELEENHNQDDEAAKGSNNNSNGHNMGVSVHNELMNHHNHGLLMENEGSPNCSLMVIDNNNNNNNNNNDATGKQGHDATCKEEKGHEMEPQVEVKQVEGNEFFLKVLCEQKQGGFARLMEAMSSLAWKSPTPTSPPTNPSCSTSSGSRYVNATIDHLDNIFLQKRDNEAMQAEQVRDSLLEVTRDSTGGWMEAGQAKSTADNGGMDYHHHRHHHFHHQLNSHHNIHYLNH
uniref:BHLH domain-containing protein n=2 Tax=Ananas comosus TaxID=4615 RepID=A0A6V7NRW7_ANACO|nr:unnamed protein product [Ananas comosus var. bracteatus]